MVSLAARDLGSWSPKIVYCVPERPIDIWFGPEIPFDDLRARGSRLAIQKAASDRCLDGIRALADEHRGGARAPRRASDEPRRDESSAAGAV